MAGEISTIPRDVAIDREGDNIQKLIDWLETTLGTALLSSLNTTVKTSLVAAINELKAGLPATNIADPGNGGAIPVTASGVCSLTIGAGAETRTLAAPTFVGQRIGIGVNAVTGGTAALTVASAFNIDGDTVYTFSTAGDYIELVAVLIGSAFRWREASMVERVDGEIATVHNKLKAVAVAALTAAAEAGNARVVTIAVKDVFGTALLRVQRLVVELFDTSMVHALAAAWTLAETGAGSEVSVTAQASLIIDTDANGAASITVTDVSGAAVTTVYLKVTPVSADGTTFGMPTLIELAFA